MIIIILAYLGVFYISLIFGQWLCRKFSFISQLGEKIYTKKHYQLNNSSFFNPLRKAINESSLAKAIAFIFPLIFIKSIAFYYISFVLITPIVLIGQGIIMGSLFVYNDKQTKNNQNLKIITFWQLSSHIIAGSYGTLKGLEWLLPNSFDSSSFINTSHSIFFYLILTLLTALIASYFEAKSIIIKADF
jgi:hypothetical protein